MAVLVTGGAGYIGSHCVNSLQDKGHSVVTFDNFSTGHHFLVRSPLCVEGELHDTDRLTELMLKHSITAVIHFAAVSQVAESVKDPLKYYHNNLGGALSLLVAMEQAGVRHFIFSSTAAVYGIPNYTPIDEEHPTSPVNPYGESKLAVESCLKTLAKSNIIQSVAFRYFNAAGASLNGSVGECHEPETHLIPCVLKNIAAGKPVSVYGNDYDTLDGTCVRDYVHVDDIVSAHVDALNYLREGGASTVLNLGNETGTTVLEIIRACEAVTGKSANLKICDRRAGDPPILVANCQKAKKLLGYTPSHTNITDIIASAWQWEKTGSRSVQTP